MNPGTSPDRTAGNLPPGPAASPRTETSPRPGDFGPRIGTMESGPTGSICDVPGVLVGHRTLAEGSARTGVTAILPHPGNLFREKVPAAVHVINGFGKSAGLVQVAELGSIETPIVLTNTLCVGRAFDAIVGYSLERNADIGLSAGTVNPVVGECNDGALNDIRGMHVQVGHVREAIDAASATFARGAVGAGTGMTCFGLKGGIGSASRLVRASDLGVSASAPGAVAAAPDTEAGPGMDATLGTVGAIVLSNFGALADLTVDGRNIGPLIRAELAASRDDGKDKGSIIMVLATDLPLSDRQLGRMARRALVGLARTGSRVGHGSGDIVIAFSTVNRILQDEARPSFPAEAWNETMLDPVFRAVAESVEEAVLDSMLSAETTTGRDGLVRRSLAGFAHLFGHAPGQR